MQSYIDKVLSGEYVTCKATLNAVKRHENDLKRTKDPDFPYEFDQELGNKAVKFIEMLPDPKGGTHKLAGFQKFIIENIYGWVRKDNHGLRRYHKVFVSMARKQGKPY